MKKFIFKSGFALIEMMICIAIVAIMFAGTIRTMTAYHWMIKETYYSAALRQMHIQEKIIGDVPFDRMPPEVLRVPDDGRLQLSNKHIVNDSLEIQLFDSPSQGFEGPRFIDKTLLSVDSDTGLVTILDPSFKGKQVIANYDFLLPDYGEAFTVPKNEPYEIELFNPPALSIENIEMVKDNRFTSISLQKVRFFEKTQKLGFDKELAGKIVRVSYLGGIIRNTCSGEFLDDDLKPSSTPTRIKLIKIRESYGGKQDIETGVMKVRK